MSIDLNDLEAELVRARRKASDWSALRTQFVLERKDQHAAFLCDQTAKLNSLQSQKTQLQVQAEQTNKRLQHEEEEMKRTEERLVGANTESGVSERRLEASQAQLRKRQEEYRQKVEELENEQKDRQQQLDNLRRQAARFTERFGLHFRSQTPGDFTVVMTHIDPKDHKKEFSVAVRMAPNDVYTVTKCDPHVPDLDELVNEVNRTNDFAAFVKAVRSRFVAVAQRP
ncbi:hypothetical protein Vafri_6461 [Volvox africanus]|uniref:Kinetochore protein SPC25 n=1 Tax=Volvox africanus TaxID=51714 RepID=A0A8J4AYP4_9CHLO|nr:hypothetical protein Vafri_6461 [Volvox africanus]